MTAPEDSADDIATEGEEAKRLTLDVNIENRGA